MTQMDDSLRKRLKYPPYCASNNEIDAVMAIINESADCFHACIAEHESNGHNAALRDYLMSLLDEQRQDKGIAI